MIAREEDCLRALRRSAEPLAVTATIVRRRPWASALFTGTRMSIAVSSGDDEALDAWLATLFNADLPLRSGFVASADVIERGAGCATIDLLAIDGE